MQDEEDELVRRLFAEATALLEDAHDIAVAGQGTAVERARRRALSLRLEHAAGSVSALARAAHVMLEGGRRPD